MSSIDDLMKQSSEMVQFCSDHASDIQKRHLEALEILQESRRTSSLRTNVLFQEIFDHGSEVTGRILDLSDGVSAIIKNYRKADFDGKLRQMLDKLAEVDIEKFAQAGEAHYRRHVALEMPDVATLCVVSASLPYYSLICAHYDSALGFLNKPTVSRTLLSNAAELVKAAAVDMAGKAIPFLGTLMTAVTLFEPWIDKEIDQMAKTVGEIDRLFDYDDRLVGLAEYAKFAERSVQFADQSLSEFRSSFDSDIGWLINTLDDAKT